MYLIVYHVVALVSRYVSYRGKMYRCSPIIHIHISTLCITVEPCYNEIPAITNDILQPGQSYSKMYGMEPRCNKIPDENNPIQKPKLKIYPDIL